MNQRKYILLILLFSLALVSCAQTKTDKHANVISDSTNRLTGKIQNLLVDYTVFGCACPTWKRKDIDNDNDTTKSFLRRHFYIEPANESLKLPIYFDPFRHFLKIKGQFYENEDYPQGTIQMEESLPKAEVFRYTELEVLDNLDFKPDTKIQTLILNFNAISCNCAQWSESKFNKSPDGRIYYWLEPANKKLIIADDLFDGLQLPVQIKVTGQIVSENGFPRGRNLTKVSQEEAGKVFRYTKIEVIGNGGKRNAD